MIVSSIPQENNEGMKQKPWLQQLNVFWKERVFENAKIFIFYQKQCNNIRRLNKTISQKLELKGK